MFLSIFWKSVLDRSSWTSRLFWTNSLTLSKQLIIYTDCMWINFGLQKAHLNLNEWVHPLTILHFYIKFYKMRLERVGKTPVSDDRWTNSDKLCSVWIYQKAFINSHSNVTNSQVFKTCLAQFGVYVCKYVCVDSLNSAVINEWPQREGKCKIILQQEK